MNRQDGLCNTVRNYLCTFYCILEEMISGMTEAVLSDSISHNFIVQMIPHHQGAIEMSKNILKYRTNISLQNIAAQIITEQTKSIENMQKILCTCGRQADAGQDLSVYQRRMDQIMHIMFSDMRCTYTSNRVDCNFMREMIPHHRGAVEMASTTLQYPICPELNPILQAIITSQKRGILQMQSLLQCIGCQTP